MRLNIFNRWEDLTKWSEFVIQYQTSKKGESFITYIRDKNSGALITSGVSRNSREESLDRATKILKNAGVEGVRDAVTSGSPINPSKNYSGREERDTVDWRDGTNHRYRAQKKIVQ